MLTRRTTVGLLAAAPASLTFFPGKAIAREREVFQNPIAINAIDPVGYFEQNRPVRGSADHSVEWNGAEWHFASQRNASMFASDPGTYAPVFGATVHLQRHAVISRQRSPRRGRSTKRNYTSMPTSGHKSFGGKIFPATSPQGFKTGQAFSVDQRSKRCA